MTSSNLKMRLEKLEALSAVRIDVFAQTVLIGVYEDNADQIIGAGILGKQVLREADETINALSKRASRQLGMQVLFAVYIDGTEAC